jgi:hypothetical protein
MKLKKSEIPQKNLDKNDDFVYSIPLFCCSFFFLNKKTEIIQRVEGKKNRPIVHKIRYLIFVGELKKNVTRQTLASSISFWRVLVSVHSPFWRVLKKMVSQTDTLYH